MTLPSDQARADRLASVLSRSPFHAEVGFRVERAADGVARLRLPYAEGNTTAQTALHGGAIAATLDAGGAMAAWASGDAEPGRLLGRTLSIDVSYVAGALGEDIFGEGEVLRRGKEIVYGAVRAVNAAGKLLAHANHIYHLSDAAGPSGQHVHQAAPGREKPVQVSLPPRNDAVVARNVDLLRKLDGRMPYMARLGWTLESADYGFAAFRLPCRGAAVGDDGGLSSGALISAVDHAGSLAAWMTVAFGTPELFGSTVNSKVHIFAPRLGRDAIVEARAVGGYGDLFHSEVDVVSEDGQRMAQGSTIYRIVERRR